MRPPVLASASLAPLAPLIPSAQMTAGRPAPVGPWSRRGVLTPVGGIGLAGCAARRNVAGRWAAWRASATSALIHAGIFVALVHATAQSAPPPPVAPTTGLVFVRPPDPAPRMPASAARTTRVVVPRIEPVPALIAPLDIPVRIPAVTLSLPPTATPDFREIGRGTSDPFGTPGNSLGGGSAGDPSAPFLAFQVETPVVALPGGTPPRYPELLKTAGVEGEVVMQFVVDGTGRVERWSLTALRSTHPLFTLAVEHALGTMRFHPAQVAGHPVRQLVQQDFVFRLGAR